MWRFLSIFGLFIISMGIAAGIHDGNLTLELGLAAVLLVFLIPLVYFSMRFAERSSPSDVFRLIKIAILVGVMLTCIAGIIGIITHKIDKKSDQSAHGTR